MHPAVWTADRERRRRDAVVDALRGGTLGAPAWVLCPREPLRAALTAQLAARGGAFVRFVDWNVLAHSLDDLLRLPFAAPIAEVDRAYLLERALFAQVGSSPQLATPLRSDPFGVALGLLRVVDLLRAHRWHGALPPRPRPPTPGEALVDGHLGLLGGLLETLEAQQAARAQLDTLGRLGRAEGALRAGQTLPRGRLWVDGIDRLAPLERDVLLGLEGAGWSVDVAPWVAGWKTPVPEGPDPEILDPGVAVTVVEAPDVHVEAESVAGFVAEAVARGAAPEGFAVAVHASSGGSDRVRWALSRWGVVSSGPGSLEVSRSPLWQLVRAAVRLVWTGVDVVDLATLFAAPGSGLWGAERDSFVARLRRGLPTTWEGVRAVLMAVTSPPPPEPAPPGGVAPEPDPRRLGLLAEMRQRAGALLDLLESHGPFGRVPPGKRALGLDAVVTEVLDRFCKPSRFGEALHDPRVQTAWLGASQAITAACRTALDRLGQSTAPLPPRDPGAFLGPVEALLGSVPEGESPPRRGGVRVRVDDPFGGRPETLVVTGLVRAKVPSPVAPWLLLGTLERARLAEGGADLGALPTESDLGALAWRDAWRTLSLPTRSLVLCVPARLADGSTPERSPLVEAVLAHVSEAGARSYGAEGPIPAARWAHPPEGPRTRRGRLLGAVSAVGAGDPDGALTLLGSMRDEPAVRDLVGARFRPDRDFVLGELAREALSAAVLTPQSLESLLTCRYRFLTQSLLRMTPLRLARAPSLGAGDRTRVTRAALRGLDAVLAAGAAPTAQELDAAVEGALAMGVPWMAEGEGSLEGDALRRGVRAFLQRYLDLRRAWNLDRPHDPPPPEPDPTADPPVSQEPALRLVLEGGRTVSVDPRSPRMETLVLPSGDGTATGGIPVVLDLSLRTAEGSAKLRAAGLDLEAVLAHAVAAGHPGGEHGAGAFVRFSLSRPEVEALVPVPGEGPVEQRLAAAVTGTLVRLDPQRGLDALQHTGTSRIAEVLDALDRPDGAYPPHTPAEREALTVAGARSCERCSMQLGCRFGLAGGPP